MKTHTERVQEVLREDSEDRKTGCLRFPSRHFITSVRSTETQESLLWAPGTNRGLTVSREHQVSRHDPSPSISTIRIIHSIPVALYSHTSSLCHDFYRYHFEPFSKAQECTSVHYNYNQQSKQWVLKIYIMHMYYYLLLLFIMNDCLVKL